MQQLDEQNIPIDIHTTKLLDWLISRRHCKQEWQNDIQIIRQKINTAIQDMPAVDEIVQLLSGAYINYFNSTRVVDLLKDTESSSKNIFGRYSSQRMKDWQEIVKLYEKDNVYLAEAAQMLIRNVVYEVPSLKRQIAKCHQIQEECDKKEVDYQRHANELREKYHTECKQFGIEGALKTEIAALLGTLPKTYEEIANRMKILKPARRYYSSFRTFVLESDVGNVLPMIDLMIDRGNVTTYEWKMGKKPKEVREYEFKISLDDESENAENETDTIDFGDEDESNEISWDIETPVVYDAENLNIGNDGIAEGVFAMSILDNPDTRILIIDELSELESFLDQRLIELQNEGNNLSFDNFQNASSNALMQSKEDVTSMLSHVRKILQSLTNFKMLNLQLIRSSPNYVDRLCQQLKQKLLAADKILKRKDGLLIKRQQIIEEEKTLHPRLKLIISRTAELQSQIEGDISKRYKNRPVNLMGGVNTL